METEAHPLLVLLLSVWRLARDKRRDVENRGQRQRGPMTPREEEVRRRPGGPVGAGKGARAWGPRERAGAAVGLRQAVVREGCSSSGGALRSARKRLVFWEGV